ncbi:MAG: hypothetical protein H7039_14025 [Bryobacteraceae bacterium]|nr:hypothetical protein [Bryobacteraceae bacterium]
MFNHRHTGTLVCLLAILFAFTAVPAFAQYGGPSILSRGGNSPGRRGNAPVNFTGHVGTTYRYETGLLFPIIADGERVFGTSDSGYSLNAGVYGGHDWKNDSVGVDYRGDYRRQVSRSQFNGSNHAISIDYSHRQGRRWIFFVRETGGTTNRAFGGFASPAFPSNDTGQGIPLAELFDIRTNFAQSSAYATYEKSGRTSFTFGGQGFFVRRENLSLINTQGYSLRASVSHRLDRSNTLSLEYQYLRYEFPRLQASTNTQGVLVRFKRRLTQSISADVGGGFYQLDSIGTATVTVSPEVAAILGRPTTRATFNRSSILPNVDARLTYGQERGAANFTVTSGVSPGNGVFITSNRTTVSGGYSYTGIRRAAVGLNAGYTRSGSVALDLGALQAYQASAGLSYRLYSNLSFTSNFDYRSFSGTATSGRSGTGISLGVTWSTSYSPLAIW